jgi:hypothetical protein
LLCGCLFILLIVGIVLIGRAAYVALQIKKPEKTGKYGANPKTAILVMAALGAVCFIAGGVGFGVMNAKEKTVEPPQPQVTFNVDLGSFANSETNQKIVNAVYGHFVERSRGRSKIEKIEITLRHFEPTPYDLYRQEDYGWYNEFTIIIKIADDDNTIYEGLPMMGNNLFYEFGGGKRSGMSMTKAHSAYFYGFKKDMITQGEETFVDDGFYKIIDELEL